jgi:hypothetical protein
LGRSRRNVRGDGRELQEDISSVALENEMTPVKSSSVAAIDHDPATKALTVQFHNGGMYRFDGVSPDQHAKLMGADSIGSHFQRHIRTKFKGVKV